MVVGAAACKKTVEGENKAWERNVARVGELAALYPGFAAALNEQKKKAEEAMAAARGISDHEQAAKKMADANALLDASFVAKLGGIDAKQKQVREKSVTVSSAATDPADAAAAKAAVDDAQRILKNVDEALKTGAPTADAATAVVRKIEDDLTSAAANLDKVIAAAKAKKEAAAKAASAAPGATGGGPGATGAVAKAPDWQCPYCKHMNPDARMTCTECGASKPAPGAAAKPGTAAKPGAAGAKK
jgi:hypothetical protein